MTRLRSPPPDRRLVINHYVWNRLKSVMTCTRVSMSRPRTMRCSIEAFACRVAGNDFWKLYMKISTNNGDETEKSCITWTLSRWISPKRCIMSRRSFRPQTSNCSLPHAVGQQARLRTLQALNLIQFSNLPPESWIVG